MLRAVVTTLVTLVTLLRLSGAAKLGDSGPGWKVDYYWSKGTPKQRVLYCTYDGMFRLSPLISGDWYSCYNQTREYMTFVRTKCRNDKVRLRTAANIHHQPNRSHFYIKSGSSRSATIVADRDCGAKYLTAPVSPADVDDYEEPYEPVPLTLSESKKWKWSLIAFEDAEDSIDCLTVDLGTQGTLVAMNPQCNGFYYDGDIGTWNLHPVIAGESEDD
ncbi:hypothetical protein M9434_004533 [Picochlorum sp. BPE23]|nr:hypothetical protein M9434_004533 [Picochlorum sp. BPE23]